MTKEDRSLGNMGELSWGCPEANLEVIGEVIPGTPQQGVGKGDGKLKGVLEGRSLLWAAGLHPVRASGRWCILPESPQRLDSDPLNSVRSWLGLCQGWSLPSTSDRSLLPLSLRVASRNSWTEPQCWRHGATGTGMMQKRGDGGAWPTGLGDTRGGPTPCVRNDWETRIRSRREPVNKPLISLRVILILEWRLCSKISF